MPSGEKPAASGADSRAERLNTRAASVVGLAVLCSRILGLAREQIFAALFGGGRVMDAFTIAFRIPNLLRDLFAEGALSTAFVTVFTRTATLEDEAAAWRLANKVATLTAVTLSAITILGILWAPALVAALAPGFDPEKAELTVTLTRVMYPFILLVSLAALVMGMLNARNVFGIPAMASSFFNLGSIIAGVTLGYWLDPHFGERAILGLAIGTLVGGALQLLVQLPTLRREGYHYHADFAWRDPGVKALLRLMGPSVIAASTTQVNVLINSVFASELGDGPTFWLTVAFRLMQLPLGIFGVALGTVALPLLARMAATGNMVAFRSELARGMRLAFLLTIPASVGLIVLAEPIISVLYQHGRFGAYRDRRIRRRAAFLCHRPVRLRGTEGAGERLLRDRSAQDTDGGELHRRGAQSDPEFRVHARARVGPSRAGILDRLRGHEQFPHPLFSDALAPRAPGIARDGDALVETRARLAGAPRRARGPARITCSRTGRSQPFWPKCASLLLVIAVSGAGFFLCANALRIAEVHDIVQAVRRRLQRRR